MYSDSRKAQRNSFAHHRAELLVATQRAFAGDAVEWAMAVHDGAEPADRVALLVHYARAALSGPAYAGAAA
jgi:hypothetical protein